MLTRKAQRTPFSRALTKGSAAIGAAAVVLALTGFGATAASAAEETVPVTAAHIAADKASGPGAGRWLVDTDFSTAGGDYAVAEAPAGGPALQLKTPAGTDGVRVLKALDSGQDATDLPALLANASYTYSGAIVNFQTELYFTPKDAAQFGPTGTTPCARAIPGNDELCYTVLKWEPFSEPSGWKTIDLSADTAADSKVQQDGWNNSQRVGVYAKPGPRVGNKLSEYLDQMASYTVLDAGVSQGSGVAVPSGWVRDLSFGGTKYTFALHEPAVSTTSTLEVSPADAAAQGDEVTLTAKVAPASAVGSFEILDGSSSLGHGDAADGKFTVKTADLSAGTHDLKAVFTPAEPIDFTASTSPSVSFLVNEKAAPADPPADDTAALEDIIADQHLDVDATTESFVPADGAEANPLDALDPDKGLSGSLPWADSSDSFVDVYAYSTPLFLGTFPVKDGAVQLDGVDLSSLVDGDHHLVFQGQTSQAISVMAVTVETPADTGANGPGNGDGDNGDGADNGGGAADGDQPGQAPDAGSDPAAAAPGDGTTLPRTGATVEGFVPLSVTLLVLGGGALLLVRRRSQSR